MYKKILSIIYLSQKVKKKFIKFLEKIGQFYFYRKIIVSSQNTSKIVKTKVNEKN